MNDYITYRIEVSGRINENDLTTNSPLTLREVCSEPNLISFLVNTDQSGLIGMIRYLNGLRLIILTVECTDCDR
jgi:hypothetical protein